MKGSSTDHLCAQEPGQSVADILLRGYLQRLPKSINLSARHCVQLYRRYLGMAAAQWTMWTLRQGYGDLCVPVCKQVRECRAGVCVCVCVCAVQTQECVILATICISKILPVIAMSAPPSFYPSHN